MSNLDTLLSAISTIMDSPAFAERGNSFAGMARISLLVALGGFVMIWKSVERGIAAGIQNSGDLQWSFGQSLRVMGLVFLSATLIDASLLAAATGAPGYLLATQAIMSMSDGSIAMEQLERVQSDARISMITEAIRAHARSALLHAGLCLAAALFVVICIAREPMPSFKTQRSTWFGLALMLGLFGWPVLTNGDAWAALTGDIEPYLRHMISN